MMTPELREYLRSLPGRCYHCQHHVATQGHGAGCEALGGGTLPRTGQPAPDKKMSAGSDQLPTLAAPQDRPSKPESDAVSTVARSTDPREADPAVSPW